MGCLFGQRTLLIAGIVRTFSDSGVIVDGTGNGVPVRWLFSADWVEINTLFLEELQMVNRVFLIGRLGKDPELRYTTSGKPVASFSMATDERWVDSEGNRQTNTEWHRIVAWKRLAEICGQYLKKGKLVFIEGRLQTREWDDRDGNKRRTTEIVALNMQMLDRGNAPESVPESAPETSSAAVDTADTAGQKPMEVGITDDDIPF